MNRFIQRFADKISGVLSGFDRLVLRGTLRPIAYARGMNGFLWHKQILLKDFGRFVESITTQLREASCRAALEQKCPIIYLPSCKTDKQSLAQQIAARDDITKGLVAVISCVSFYPQQVAIECEIPPGKVKRRGSPDFISVRINLLECLSGGLFGAMLRSVHNHLGDLPGVRVCEIWRPRRPFYPRFSRSPNGYLNSDPPKPNPGMHNSGIRKRGRSISNPPGVGERT